MENYKFSTLEYKRPDLEARRTQLAQWKAAVQHAEDYAALRALMLEIDRETCELFTQYSIAHIRHTLDTRDEFYEAEIQYLQDTLPTLSGAEVALSEASALNLHDNAAIPVHAMTVKKAAESYGWEDQYPAEVAQWLRESTDVSDAIIWTETAASYEWILNAFEARFEGFEAKTYLEGEHGFIFIQQQKNGMKGEKLVDYPVDEALEMTKTLDPVLIDVCNTISI